MDFQPGITGTCFRLLKNSLRAPVDPLEKLQMNLLQADQIISAVIGWAEHNSISRFAQDLDCFSKGACRNRRTVGINQAYGFEPDLEEVFGRANQALVEPVATLRQKLELVRENSGICFFSPERGVNSNSPRRASGRNSGERRSGVPQETGVQSGSFFRSQRGR